LVGDSVGVEEGAHDFGADSEVDILGNIARNPRGADGVQLAGHHAQHMARFV